MFLEPLEAEMAFSEAEALWEEFFDPRETVRKDRASLDSLTSRLFEQSRKDIQSLLNYTECLKGSTRNPFAKALDFPLHPLMNLI